MLAEIPVNTIIEGVGDAAPFTGVHRVLYVDPSLNVYVRFGMAKPFGLPVPEELDVLHAALKAGTAKVTQFKTRSVQLLPDERLEEAYKKSRDDAWNRISSMVSGLDRVKLYFPDTRGIVIRNRCEALKVGKNQVYADLRRYWAYGQTKAALLPDWKDSGPRGEQKKGTAKRGKKPLAVKVGKAQEGISLGDSRERMEKGARLFFVGNATIPKAFARTKDTFFNDGWELKNGILVPILKELKEVPTENQFRNLVRTLNRTLQITRKKAGELLYNLKLRALEGKARHGAFGPGARYEIDSTILDIYLVSSFNSRWIIGRPVLYVVVDVFSRMVVGFYLGLEGPSWAGARLALANAFTDKVKFCAEYGVQITKEEWPAAHVPHKVLADRGDMLSAASDELANSLGVIIEQTPPRRPDWKPFVERDFGMITEGTVIFLPGAVDAREAERLQRDYRLDACLNLRELTTILINAFLDHNATNFRPTHLPAEMIEDGFVDATPNSLWKWGMENVTGHARTEEPEFIRSKLLPIETGYVRGDGIHFGGERFICPTAREENWLARARANKTWRVSLRVDGSTDRVWWQHEGTGALEPCEPLDPDIRAKPKRFEEVADKMAILRLAEDAKEAATRQKSAERRAHNNAIAESAAEKAKRAKAGLNKRQILEGIEDHRKVELEVERMERMRREAQSNLPPKPSNALPAPAPTAGATARRLKLMQLAQKGWEKVK